MSATAAKVDPFLEDASFSGTAHFVAPPSHRSFSGSSAEPTPRQAHDPFATAEAKAPPPKPPGGVQQDDDEGLLDLLNP